MSEYSMQKDEIFKLPRLYTSNHLMDKGVIALSSGQAHYLGNVLRRKINDKIRLFNGYDGEWVGTINNINKKSVEILLEQQFLPQPTSRQKIHLIFAPIKKNRMDWLIEKSVELGVSALHPVLTQNTEIRKLKTERIEHQIIEASEQCERLDIPTLHELCKLEELLKGWSKDIEIQACLERMDDATPLKSLDKDVAILIGPEGGFTEQEKQLITQYATVVTLGEQILRTETAALKVLAVIKA